MRAFTSDPQPQRLLAEFVFQVFEQRRPGGSAAT
jgi:hypothetical protein